MTYTPEEIRAHIDAQNATRAARGAAIIREYRAKFAPSEYPPEEGTSATQTALADLLADLMHAVSAYPAGPSTLDFGAALDTARMNHAAEMEGE